MINALTVACSILLSPGVHPVECTAFYRHTVAGQEYTSVKTTNLSAYFPLVATCSGEGHPYKVEMRRNGVLECSATDGLILQDGFESGDAGAWSNATP